VGGNSGSPVINRDGELVGLLFDGNIEGLVATFVFFPENNRSVCVCSEAIIEVLKKVYDANELVQEITGVGK